MTDYRWVLLSFVSLFALVGNYLLNRALSHNYSPLITLGCTGLFQSVICGILLFFSKEKFSSFTSANLVMSIVFAVCVLVLDWAMIAAYKLGGNSVIITLIVSMATVIVLPISYFIFKESISKIQLLGVFLSIVSIVLVVMFPKTNDTKPTVEKNKQSVVDQLRY